MSQARASEKPAPAAAPSTAAMMGLGCRWDGLNPLVQAFNALGLPSGLLAVGLQALQVTARRRTCRPRR